MPAIRVNHVSKKNLALNEQVPRSGKITREMAREVILNAGEFGVHPIYKTLAEAPIDDEELTEKEILSLEISRAEAARGEVMNFNDAVAKILESRKNV